jgi:ABC-type amino acid transport substrate-binding protein
MWSSVRLLVISSLLMAATALGADGSLDAIGERGELRHLGIRYAAFVTGAGDGLEVDVARLFAARLGVDYVFVETDWAHAISDLLGAAVIVDGDHARRGDPAPRRGDLIATGMTVLPWRQDVVAFSRPTFPTQIWLIAAADSPLTPITPTHDLERDILATRALMDGNSVLAKPNTCLAPELYRLDQTGARVVLFDDQLKFMAGAILAGQATTTILDVPDALMALRHYPGRIKVLGPISEPQTMAAAFDPGHEELRQAYDAFLAEIMADGTYDALIDRYYPAVRSFFPDFFAPKRQGP